MVCDVIGPSSEFKVLKAVVVLDAVEVVDVLVLAESAPKVALHDEAMFEDVEAKIREWRGAERDTGVAEEEEDAGKGKRRKL